HENSGRYDAQDWHMPYILQNEIPHRKKKELMDLDESFMLSAGAIYSTFDAMEEVMRPGEEAIYKELNVSHKIAWKTGTSFGYRDGWAIGCTPRYVVGVWVGNADGEGRPGLTGIATAAPAMFEIFSMLPSGAWFDMPYDDMTKVAVCDASGYRASAICDKVDSVWVPNAG
ncbi:penicillin-binding protein 1C, partial [bacterium]|nr:penicillin-binding protein 1C [bacterium]